MYIFLIRRKYLRNVQIQKIKIDYIRKNVYKYDVLKRST